MTSDSLFNANWHQVRDLKPKLAEDVQVFRQFFRGVSSHLLNRASTGRSYRMDSRVFDLIARLDGQTSVNDAWLQAHESLAGEDAPSQTHFLELLSSLYNADLLVLDRRVDIERLFQRQSDESSLSRRQRLANPLYLRFALCNPDIWLTRMSPWTNGLFTKAAAVIWICLIVTGLICSLPNLSVISAELSELNAQSASFVVMFVLLYCVMKLLHELGHACAVKRFDGAVQEMGIALMVLLPNPYTDCSAASLFSDKHSRMIVSAAGILVELALAAVAAIVWTNSTGLVHHAALIVMVTGGVSTLLFNGNPLMKFDAYHLLADWIEIPNLAGRSRRYVLNLLARRVLKQNLIPIATSDRKERQWLLAYAVLSVSYRGFLMLSIAWMLSGQYFFFGVMLAAYVIFSLLVKPFLQFIQYFNSLPPSERSGSTMPSLAIAMLFVVVLFVIPVPNATTVDAVVWLPEEATLRAELDCEIAQVFVEPGTFVEKDVALLACLDDELEFELNSKKASLDGLVAQVAGLSIESPVEARQIESSIALAKREIEQLEHQKRRQMLSSQAAGQFLVESQQALKGQYFAQGAVVAYIVPQASRTIRLLLSQDEIGGLASSEQAVSIAMVNGVSSIEMHETVVVRKTPKPVHRIVSPALTQQAGGRLAVEQDPQAGTSLAHAAYDLELAWPETATESPIGQRLRVKFAKGTSPLASLIASSLRQAFMGRLSA